jgi:hypothetical protein
LRPVGRVRLRVGRNLDVDLVVGLARQRLGPMAGEHLAGVAGLGGVPMKKTSGLAEWFVAGIMSSIA